MIFDHAIVSARTEMRKEATKDRRFMRRMIAASIGAALAVPALAAWGMDSPHARQPFNGAAIPITLPPVPYIDSIPWMQWDANAGAFKTDLLPSPTQRWGIEQVLQPDGKQKLSAN